MLSGCGGGGGGPSLGGGGDLSPFATVRGIASKGTLKHAVVTAKELDASGREIATVGSAETDDHGSYNLTVSASYQGGPIRLILTPKADGSTRMVCDTTLGCDGVAFGADVALPADFSLEAVLSPVHTGDMIQAQITPYTHMASARVRAAALVNAEAVKNANSEVGQLVGSDVLTSVPVDITSVSAGQQNDAQLMYGALNAALARLAASNHESLSVTLRRLGAAFADGRFDGNDNGFDFIKLVDAMEAEANALAQARAVDVAPIQHLASALRSQAPSGVYDPQPSSAATLTAIGQGKTMVGEVRTLFNSMAALQTPLQAFDVDARAVRQVLNQETVMLAKLLAEVGTGVRNYYFSNRSLGPGVHLVPISINGQLVNVNVVVAESAAGTTLSINESNLFGVSMNVELSTNVLVSGIPTNAVSLNDITLGIRGSISDAVMTMVLDNASMSYGYAANDPAVWDPANQRFSSFYSMGSALLKGKATVTDRVNNASFSGEAALKFVRLAINTAETATHFEQPISIEEIQLAGKFAAPMRRFDATAKLNFANAANFDTLAYFTHRPEVDTYGNGQLSPAVMARFNTWAGPQQGGDPYGFYYTDGTTNLGTQERTCLYRYDTLRGYGYSVSCVDGDYLGVKEALSARYPDALGVSKIFAGYSPRYSTAFYNAHLVLGSLESATNYGQGTLTVNLDVAMQGYPNTQATITLDRTGYRSGVGTVTLSHGGQGITLRATGGRESGSIASGTVTASNADGVTLTVSGTAATQEGSLTVDGNAVATLSKLQNGLWMIRYSDGSFDTLQ